MSSNTALVTGATGYIGSHLVRKLRENAYTVHVLVRPDADLVRSTGLDGATIHYWPEKREGYLELLQTIRPTCIFNLIATQVPVKTVDDFSTMLEANFLLGAQLLQAASQVPGISWINAGSYWEYDDQGNYHPNTLYAALKGAFRSLIPYYSLWCDVRTVNLILFDTYGPGDWRKKILSRLIEAGRSGEAIDLTEGLQKIDWVHVNDVTDACLHAAKLLRESPEIVGKSATYTVGTSQHLSLRESVTILEQALGKKIQANWGKIPRVKGQIEEPMLANSPPPAWAPKIEFADGIRSVLKELL